MSPNNIQYNLGRKAIAVVLAQDSDIVIADIVAELGFVLDQTIGCCVRPKRPGHFPQECSHTGKLAGAFPVCLGQKTYPQVRIKASVLKIGLLFVSYNQRAAPKGTIDVGPAFTQGVQDGSGTVLVRNVETSFTALETDS